jgi:hypothetical protein
MQSSRSRRVITSDALYVAQLLEPRRLMASLFDLVGATLPDTAPRGSDSQQDIYWLANHVDQPTLARLEKTDTVMQSMYAQFLRDGKDFDEITIHNVRPIDAYQHNAQGPLAAIHTNNAAALSQRLTAMGFQVSGFYDGVGTSMVDVYTPVSRIAELAGVEGVKGLNAQVNPVTSAGSVQSEWVAVANLPQLNTVLPGIDGTNIDVGIFSDSFNSSIAAGGSLAAGQASGDLPPGSRVNILVDGNGTQADEGRAMAELVYDAAPDVDIIFNTGNGGRSTWATAINNVRVAGADVIVDDLTYPDEFPFQDDVLAQAVNTVVGTNNIPYFDSAGNQNGDSWFGTYLEGTSVNNDVAFDGAGDERLNLTINNGSTLTACLSWGETLQGAAKDFDLYLMDGSNNVVASTTSNQIGSQPTTTLTYLNNTGGTQNLSLRVRYQIGAGSVAGLQLFLITYGNGVTQTDALFGGPSIYGHHNNAFGFSVGAVPASNPGTIEAFSSRGGLPILFNTNGTPVSGGVQFRNEPAFVAADGITNTFFGGGNVFFGTSAAAPDAAAIAALMLEAAGGAGSLSPSQIETMLKRSTFELGASGYDTIYGEGRVDGLAAVAAADAGEGSSSYLELNQFGFGTTSQSMTNNSITPSIDFAFDAGGSVSLLQTIGGSSFSYGAQFEYGDPGSALLLQTNRVEPLVLVTNFSGWSVIADTRHSLSVFSRTDMSTVPGGTADDITFFVDGPNSPQPTITVDSTLGTGGVNSTISSRYDTDYYSFTTPPSFDTAAGVNFGASFTGGLDGVVSLYDTSGNLILRRDNAGTNGSENFSLNTLATSTSYVLRVGSYNGNSSGSYQLRIRAAKSLSGGMINIGGTFSTMSPIVPFGGSSSTNDVGQFFSIGSVSAVAGHTFGDDSQLSGTFTINVDSTQFDTVIAVYAYNTIFGTSLGEMVAFDDDSGPGSNSQITFTAQPGFRHILAVKSFDNTVGNGSYTLNVNYGGPPSSTPISLNSNGDGSVNTGSIAAGGEFSTYTFVAPATSGGATITLSNQVGDGDIYLFDSAGTLLGGNSTGGTGNETITVSSLTPGATYHITVMPEQYAATLTAATVSVDVATAATPAAPDLTSGSDLGISNTDNFTAASTNVNFLLSGPVGTFMRLFRDGVLVAGPTAVDSFGSVLLVDNGPITAGVHNYTATAALTASSGQTPASPALTVNYEFTAPAQNSFDFRFDDSPSDHKMYIDFSEDIFGFTATDPVVKYLTLGIFLDSSYFRIENFSGGTNDFYYDVTPGNDQLPDGDYEITIPAGAAQDWAGNPNVQTMWNFWFLGGDANRDRKVDTQDFNILSGHFGNSGEVFSEGNFNYDAGGNVDSQDFNLFVSKYGKKLPPLSGAIVSPAQGVFASDPKDRERLTDVLA